jgi:hypothetical protein
MGDDCSDLSVYHETTCFEKTIGQNFIKYGPLPDYDKIPDADGQIWDCQIPVFFL